MYDAPNICPTTVGDDPAGLIGVYEHISLWGDAIP